MAIAGFGRKANGDRRDVTPTCGGSLSYSADSTHAVHAVGFGVVGVAGISGGVAGGTPIGSLGGGIAPGVVGDTPTGSGCGASGVVGGLTGARVGSAGVGSG
jgi:hypothetical protein